jgi:hypothetical protein
MLYPLSYEGGDGAERGAKLGATARKPWEKGSSIGSSGSSTSPDFAVTAVIAAESSPTKRLENRHRHLGDRSVTGGPEKVRCFIE